MTHDPEGDRDAATADLFSSLDDIRTLVDAMKRIPPRQAMVIWARHVDGLSYTQIAEREHLTESQVRNLLHRGRRSLLKAFVAAGGTLTAFTAVLDQLRGLHRLARNSGFTISLAAAVVASSVLITPPPNVLPMRQPSAGAAGTVPAARSAPPPTGVGPGSTARSPAPTPSPSPTSIAVAPTRRPVVHVTLPGCRDIRPLAAACNPAHAFAHIYVWTPLGPAYVATDHIECDDVPMETPVTTCRTEPDSHPTLQPTPALP